MLIDVQFGETAVILRVKVTDSRTPGKGLVALDHTAAGLKVGVIASNESESTGYTSEAGTIDGIAQLGLFVPPPTHHCRLAKVDDDLHPGIVELQIENGRFNVPGAKYVIVSLSGAENMDDCDALIPLRSSAAGPGCDPSGFVYWPAQLDLMRQLVSGLCPPRR